MLQACAQVGVGNEGAAKSDQVSALAQRLLGQRQVVAVVDHPRALPAALAVSGFQCCVIEGRWALLMVTRATGRAFDDVHIGQAQRRQLPRHMLEQRLGQIVAGVVGGGHGRKADAGSAAANLTHHGLHDFLQKAGAVFNRAAIDIAALVAARAQKLVDQVTVGRMHLHAIKTRSHGVGGGPAVVFHNAGQLGGIECAGRRHVHKLSLAIDQQHGFAFCRDSRRGHRRLPIGLQAGVRDAAHMPQLHDDLPAFGVDRVGDLFP